MPVQARGRRSTTTQDGLGRYYTERPLARAIVRMLPFNLAEVVAEPHAGDGRFLAPLVEKNRKGHRLQLFANDLDPDAPIHHLQDPPFEVRRRDFLDGSEVLGTTDRPCSWADWPQPDWMIGNPPYSIRVLKFNADGSPKWKRHRKTGALVLEHGAPVQASKSVEVGTDHVLRMLELSRRHVVVLMPSQFSFGESRYDRLWSRHPLRRKIDIVGRPSFTGSGTSSSDYSVFWFDKYYTGDPLHGWLTGWRAA